MPYLKLEGNDQISNLIFLNTFNIKEYLNDKLTSLDVKVIDGNNKRYNIEMQVSDQGDYVPRILYYLAKLYTSQLKEGEPYESLAKSISISILDYSLLENESGVHNIYRFLNIKSKNELTDLKEIHFIELPKFMKKEAKDLDNTFEKWLYTIKYGEKYTYDINSIPESLKEDEIVMAINEMRKASEDEQIRELIEAREKARHDEASRLYNAMKQAKAEGEQIGIAKGKQELLIIKVMKLISKKFGVLPPELEVKIKNCSDSSKLDIIIDNIFDINSIPEVEQILSSSE